MDSPSPLTAAKLLFSMIVALSLSITGSGVAALSAIPFYCRYNEVQCPSGIERCLPALGICNGIKDCPDGSDENPVFCKTYDCSNIEYDEVWGYQDIRGDYYQSRKSSKCPSGNLCTKKPTDIFPQQEPYLNYFKCTGGRKECADGSDEDPQYCQQNLTCSGGEYGTHGYFGVNCPSNKYCLYPKCNRCGDGADNGRRRLCDGSRDCPDGSDEWPTFCKTNGCSLGTDQTFRCKDFGCVQTKQICNGKRDCADGSDEDPTFCAAYDCPWSNGKKCPNNRTCISQLAICDGKRDCPDGSDEKNSSCLAYSCLLGAGAWKCKDGVQCVGTVDVLREQIVEKRCNNVYDCKDKSDESISVCATFECNEFERKCPGGSGACIPMSAICDGKRDCLDGSDEDKLFCAKHECEQNEYVSTVKCNKSRLCQPGGYCDGRVDCKDKTDEDPTFCKDYQCPKFYSKCPGFPYQCIPSRYLCDGVKKHCLNGGDEDPAFCKAYTCPGLDYPYEFRVKCGLKCAIGLYCHGQPNCEDGSDEDPSFCQSYKCPPGYAKCKDGKQCADKYLLCRVEPFNNYDPCLVPTNSDAAFCSAYDCGTNFWKCTANSTRCLHDYQRCDGIVDCTNGADENPTFCRSFQCPIFSGAQLKKCPDNLRCEKPYTGC